MTTARSVYMDGHILAAPVIADLDNDGVDDLVVPVSYYVEQYVANRAYICGRLASVLIMHVQSGGKGVRRRYAQVCRMWNRSL